jgi:hypothetical protein
MRVAGQICLGCLLLAAGVPATAGKKAGVMKTIEKQVVEKDIAMLVSVPERSIVGSAIDVRVKLHNQGKRDVTFFRRMKYWDNELQLRDQKGQLIPLTRFGKMAEAVRQGRSSSVNTTLAAGKDIEITLNLARVCDVSVEGEYTLTIIRELDGINLKIEGMRFKLLDEASR